MPELLDLPQELRLQIYEYALCDQLLEIDLSEYWSDQDPKFWEQMAEPVAKLDPELASEIKALHWNRVNLVYSEYMNSFLPTSDQNFVYWLFNEADNVKGVLGGLTFLNVTGLHQCRSGDQGCVDSVEINLCTGQILIRNASQQPGVCSHAYAMRSLITCVLNKMPLKHGRLQPRLSDFWAIYEIWRLQFIAKPRFARKWKHVQSEYVKSFRRQDALEAGLR